MEFNRRSLIWSGAALVVSGCAQLPSDTALLDQFRRTRLLLERIVTMAQQESGIERIASDFVRLTDNFAPSAMQRRARLHDERWAEYKTLFRRANVPGGIGLGPDEVYFYVADTGLAPDGDSKGYLWSQRAPSPNAQNLDDAQKTQSQGFDLFRHIEGPWYLEYSGF